MVITFPQEYLTSQERSPAAKIQDAIGAENAFAFEVRNFCNSGNLGIHICRNMLLADNDLSYAL
ncbi:MAG: hypothetical protein ACYTXA_29330 [Nostoc sp.]